MSNIKTLGLIVGLAFGVMLVWQGAAAAWLVLLFAAVGWVIGSAIWVGARILSGELEFETLQQLFTTIFTSRERD